MLRIRAVDVWANPVCGWFLAMLLLLAPPCFAQNYPEWALNKLKFEHIGPEHGLSQNTVYTMLQDNQGFIWMGTQDGLNRFDGSRFKVYRPIVDDENSIAGSNITCLIEDRHGFIWAGSIGSGVSRFDRKTQAFLNFRHDPKRHGSLSSDVINGLLEDGNGNIWIATENGLNMLNPRDNRLKHYPAEVGPYGLPHHVVNVLLEDPEGWLWVGTDNGLCRMNPQNGSLTHFPAAQDGSGPIHNRIRSLYQDREQRLYVGTEQGLSVLDPVSKRFSSRKGLGEHGVPFFNISHITGGSRGSVWFGTNRGLFRLNPKNGHIQRFAADSLNPHSLSSDIITFIMEDRGNVLWVGTESKGVNRYNRAAETMVNIPLGVVTGFLEDEDGAIWITSDGNGLTRFDPQTGKRQQLLFDPNNANSPNSNLTWTIDRDRRGFLWMGSREGLNRFNPQVGEWKAYTTANSPLVNDLIFSVMVDKDDRVWAATFGGLQMYDPDEDRFLHYTYEPNNPRSISSDNLLVVYQDRQGRIWAGSFGSGLNLLLEESGTFRQFLHDPHDPNSLSEDTISQVYQDSQDRLWVATSLGFCLMDPDGGTFINYSEKDGLGNNIVYAITEDDGGFLWLSTNRGLSRFDMQARTFLNLTEEDNLQGGEFNQAAVLKSSNGWLFFGGVNGFNMFNPKLQGSRTATPSPAITGFLKFNETVALETAIEHTEFLEIPWKDRVITFEFAALDYFSPGSNQFAYTLKGFREQPILLGTKNETTFTNLDPGDYTLELRTANGDGVWNPVSKNLHLRVVPPFWRSQSAILFYAFLLIGLVYLFLFMQRRRLKKAEEINQRLTRVDRLKDEFLASTSHELCTPLNGMIGLAESLLDGAAGPVSLTMRENLSMIVANGKRLDNMVNDLLDFSHMKHHSLELTMAPVDLYALVKVVAALCKPLLGSRSVDLRSEVPADFPLVWADEHRLQQILYNLVGNAVKFTHHGKILVGAHVRDSHAEIEVVDTGIGIAPQYHADIFRTFEQVDGSDAREYGGAGLGLAVTRRLVELHGGVITVEGEEGLGSQFRFTLPLAPDSVQNQALFDSNEPWDPQYESQQLDEESGFRLDQGDGARILIVDDEAVNRRMLENTLKLKGYRVEVAEHGKQALTMLAGEKVYDLILLDIMMPRITGFDVCRALRERFSLEELPVIFLTAKNQKTDLLTAFELGANDYLTKPFSKEELLSRVSMHLHLLDVHRNLERKVNERTRELRVRNDELETLNSITKTINQEIRLESVLSVIMEQAIRLFPHADSGSFLLMTRDRATLRVVASQGYDKRLACKVRMTLAQTRKRYVEGSQELERGIYIVTNPDEATRPKPVRELPPPKSLLVMEVTLNDALEGYLVFDHNEGGFTPDDVHRLVRFREQAVSALTRARVLQDLNDSQRDLLEAAHMFGMAENATMVLHNLGNTLNSVNTSIQVVRSKLEQASWFPLLQRLQQNPEAVQARQDLIGKLCDRIGNWLGDVDTESSRIEAQIQEVLGGLRAQWAYTTKAGGSELADLRQLARGCLRMEGLPFAKHGVKLTEDLQPVPPVTVQKVKFLRVLFCLLENSLEAVNRRFEGGQGHIVLRTRNENDKAVIMVEDNGSGIDQDHLDRLFTQGFSTKEKNRVGFGLHNCANAILDMGGTITLESKGFNMGSTATIKLPTQVPN